MVRFKSKWGINYLLSCVFNSSIIEPGFDRIEFIAYKIVPPENACCIDLWILNMFQEQQLVINFIDKMQLLRRQRINTYAKNIKNQHGKTNKEKHKKRSLSKDVKDIHKKDPIQHKHETNKNTIPRKSKSKQKNRTPQMQKNKTEKSLTLMTAKTMHTQSENFIKPSEHFYDLKKEFDLFAKRLFRQILDFKGCGFVTSDNIKFNKKISEKAYYFFGSIFQQIKSKELKLKETEFIKLCEAIYIQSKQDDIVELLSQNSKKIKMIDIITNQQKQQNEEDYKFMYSQNESDEMKTHLAAEISPKMHPHKFIESNFAKQDILKVSIQQSPIQHKILINSTPQDQTMQIRALSGNTSAYDSVKVQKLTQKLQNHMQINAERIKNYRKVLEQVM